MSKLSNPAALLSTLAALLVPPMILFVASDDTSGWTRAAATAGGLGIGVLLIFGWSIIAVPPLMDREAKEREDALAETLASYDGPEEDADIREGLGWIVWREWGRTPEKDGAGRLEDVRLALEEIRKKAFRRKISVWGRGPYGDALHQDIRSDFFQTTGFDYGSMLSDDSVPQTDPAHSVSKTQYRELMVNRAEFEREWPKA